jgi:hypothetical protein
MRARSKGQAKTGGARELYSRNERQGADAETVAQSHRRQSAVATNNSIAAARMASGNPWIWQTAQL